MVEWDCKDLKSCDAIIAHGILSSITDQATGSITSRCSGNESLLMPTNSRPFTAAPSSEEGKKYWA